MHAPPQHTTLWVLLPKRQRPWKQGGRVLLLCQGAMLLEAPAARQDQIMHACGVASAPAISYN